MNKIKVFLYQKPKFNNFKLLFMFLIKNESTAFFSIVWWPIVDINKFIKKK